MLYSTCVNSNSNGKNLVEYTIINHTFNLFDGLDKIGFVMVVDGYI